MEDFIEKMVEKVGIDRETAEKVINFLKEHASELPGMLSGGMGGDLMGKIGGMFGNKE